MRLSALLILMPWLTELVIFVCKFAEMWRIANANYDQTMMIIDRLQAYHLMEYDVN